MNENPYLPPESPIQLENGDYPIKAYGGINRLQYFMLSIGIWVLALFMLPLLLNVLAQQSLRPWFGMFLFVVFYLIGVVFASYRFKNMGASMWWGVLIVIPIVNIFVGSWCLIAPPSYVDTYKLDDIGKTLVVLFTVLFIAWLVMISMPFWVS